eukprot:2737217-Alexandrium_andersonii.AAC.1
MQAFNRLWNGGLRNGGLRNGAGLSSQFRAFAGAMHAERVRQLCGHCTRRSRRPVCQPHCPNHPSPIIRRRSSHQLSAALCNSPQLSAIRMPQLSVALRSSPQLFAPLR